MPPSQVWPRRQKIQQVLAKPTLIEEVEKMNTVVIRNIM